METDALPTELRPWAAAKCIGGFGPDRPGTTAAMSETLDEPEPGDDDLLREEQEEKGYGEDEGEREEALPE